MSNFRVGNIVTYNNEYGVVIEIPEIDNSGRYVSGRLLIRWDTNKENDFEDCLGNLEGLLQKIDNYDLKYIHIDGSLKKE